MRCSFYNPDGQSSRTGFGHRFSCAPPTVPEQFRAPFAGLESRAFRGKPMRVALSKESYRIQPLECLKSLQIHKVICTSLRPITCFRVFPGEGRRYHWADFLSGETHDART
ncbi:hypothetical protein ALO81_101965 [Pseudomonas cannabina]|uniref:Uncharacterized protein n=1 Tax=Pseudomonas cannabina TaxID=86840 RepID=A0A0P9KM75_PSECA|nr:hypothetical protein ALO81_101965 [Pseudomonas cannabina]